LFRLTDIAEFSQTVLCSDGVERNLNEGIFHCADSCANIDHRWTIDSPSLNQDPSLHRDPFAIFMQDKHSALTTESDQVKYVDLYNWYTNTLGSVREYNKFRRYDAVLVFFTNRRYVGSSKGLSDMSWLLLIDKSRIKDYLSPTFAYRGLLEYDNETEQVLSQPSM